MPHTLSKTLSKTVLINDLKLGMYVLDIKEKRSDIKIRTRGLVKSQNIITQLKKQGVISLFIRADSINTVAPSQITPPKTLTVTNQTTHAIKAAHEYNSITEELTQSANIYGHATETIQNLFSDINSNTQLNTQAISALATDITESIMRNEYAISILTRLRDKATYQWEHAVNTAVLMSGFSLFLGMNKQVSTQIATGALLHDIGIAKVPKAIVNKVGKLTKNERRIMHKHVLWGHNICVSGGLNNKITTDMLMNHHERLDGSGYPKGLANTQLSTLARITAIIDVYDAMTGHKYYKQGIEPISALRYLITHNQKFDRTLVQQFIRYIGVHPVGSVVKLSNNKLAVITQGNRSKPLQPTAMVFYDTKHERSTTFKEYCLAKENIQISAAVKPEDYNINLSQVIKSLVALP